MSLYPTNRLIVFAAAVVTPMLGLAGWAVGGWFAVVLALLVGVFLLAVDAGLGWRLARGVRVRLNGSLRATQGREFVVESWIMGPAARVRVAIAWPAGCETPEKVIEAKVSHADYAMCWRVIPHRRGQIDIRAVHYEVVSPSGCWVWRGHAPAELSVKVFPELLEDRGVLAPLFLRRPAAGLHVVRQVGKGREFEQLREYLPGDSYEDIYWKGTARRGAPVTKIHQIERTQDVYIVIDASRRSLRQLTEAESPGPQPSTQMDRFVRAGLALALTAIQQGDRPGLVVFGPMLRHFLRASGGAPQVAAFRNTLFDLQARPEPPDFADVFADIGNRLRQRALLLFLTDLDDPVLADQFCEEVQSFSRKHVVLVGQLQAPGIAPVFDARRALATRDSDVYARLAGHVLWESARQTGNRLRAEGVHWVSSPSESLASEMVSAYLNIKRRQLL